MDRRTREKASKVNLHEQSERRQISMKLLISETWDGILTVVGGIVRRGVRGIQICAVAVVDVAEVKF